MNLFSATIVTILKLFRWTYVVTPTSLGRAPEICLCLELLIQADPQTLHETVGFLNRRAGQPQAVQAAADGHDNANHGGAGELGHFRVFSRGRLRGRSLAVVQGQCDP